MSMDDESNLNESIIELENELTDMHNQSSSSSNVEDLEKQLGDTEEALDLALRNKEEVTNENQHIKQLLSEKELIFADALLAKDLEIIDLQLQIKALENKSETLIKYDHQCQEQQEQISHYQDALSHLKQWGIRNFVNHAVCTHTMKKAEERILVLETQAQQRQNETDDLRSVIEAYEDLFVLQATVVDNSTLYEEKLRTNLSECIVQLNNYKTAFDQIKKKYIQLNVSSTEQIQQLKINVEKLQKAIDRNTPLMSVRWKQEQTDTPVRRDMLLYAEKLKSQNLLIYYALHNVERRFLYVTHLPKMSLVEMEVYRFGIIIHRIIYKVDALLHYFHTAEYTQLVTDAQSNVMSLAKDRCFIIWLHNTVTALCMIQASLSELSENLRCTPFKTVGELIVVSTEDGRSAYAPSDIVPYSPLEESSWINILRNGENSVDILMSLAINIYVSPSFDSSVFTTFALKIRNMLQCMENTEDRNSEDNNNCDEKTFGSVEGISPPVLLASVRRLNSVSVLGLCEVAFNEEVKKVIPPSVWQGLWDASNYIINLIPFGYASKENINAVAERNVLAYGFGTFYLPKPDKKHLTEAMFLKSFDVRVEMLESGVMEENVQQLVEKLSQAESSIQPVGEALKTMDSMCSHFEMKHTGPSTNPWETAIERAVDHFYDMEKTKQNLVECQQKCERNEIALHEMEKNLASAKDDISLWEKKYNILTREMEQAAIREEERRDKRINDGQLSLIVKQTRELVHELNEEKDRATKENQGLQLRIKEATVLLERFKEFPDHLGQSSAWMSQEIKHLRTIVDKLTKELLVLQLDRGQYFLNTVELTNRGNRSYENFRANISTNSAVVTPHEHSNGVLRGLLKAYQGLRHDVFNHFLNVPLPSKSVCSEEQKVLHIEYAKKTTLLSFNLRCLKSAVQQHLRKTDTKTGETEFGPISLIRHPEWQLVCDVNESIKQSNAELPFMKIVTPSGPYWIDKKNVSSCKVVTTPTQLHLLHQQVLNYMSSSTSK